jgi:class 3 adenylate cyclase
MSWSRTLKIRQLLRAQIEAGEPIALLFSDIRGFTALTAQEGDRAAYRVSQQHDEIIQERIDEYGIVVKSLGDGIMAAFETPLGAVQAAVEVQQAMRRRNAAVPDEPIDVGVGIASGTPVMKDIDFIGHAVNLAQRLSAISKGGQILAIDTALESVTLPQGLSVMPMHQQVLKGIGTVRPLEVIWLEEVARVSDRRDLVTAILTAQRTVVFELAKGTKQEVHMAVEQLRHARADEEGAVPAMLQRATARWVQWLVRTSYGAPDLVRELPAKAVSARYRSGALRLRTPDGTALLQGVSREEARQFVERLSAARET